MILNVQPKLETSKEMEEIIKRARAIAGYIYTPIKETQRRNEAKDTQLDWRIRHNFIYTTNPSV